MTKYLVLASIITFIYTSETRAPVPAKSQTLDIKTKMTNPMDKDLKNWFDRADSSEDYFALSNNDFKDQVSKLDLGAQIYLSLEKYKPKSKSFNIYKKKAIDFVSKASSKNHPLYTHIYLLNFFVVKSYERSRNKILGGYRGRSCFIL